MKGREDRNNTPLSTPSNLLQLANTTFFSLSFLSPLGRWSRGQSSWHTQSLVHQGPLVVKEEKMVELVCQVKLGRLHLLEGAHSLQNVMILIASGVRQKVR